MYWTFSVFGTLYATATLDDIDDLGINITQAELDKILVDDNKFINNTILEARENEISLSTEKITY